MLSKFNYIWPPAFIALIIFYLCCFYSPQEQPKDIFPYTDKIVHFLMYLGLSGVAMINYIYRTRGHIIILKLVLYALILPILYGGAIELIQEYMTDNRTGEWLDLLADTLGALAALPIALYFRKKLLSHDFLAK